MILENTWGRVEIRPQGAQVLSYVPAGGRDLLWVSPAAQWGPGQPLRGGIPLCVPWFGPKYEGKPLHGFVRQLPWTSDGPQTLADGSSRATFRLEDSPETLALWPTPFVFEHEITLGRQLTLVFRAWSRGKEAVPFELAWHTYFAVDVSRARVEGLDGEAYLDKNDQRRPGVQTGDLAVDRPLDLLFSRVAGDQVIDDGRRIRVASTAPGAVVWNAGEKDKTVVDLGEGTHLHYLCVERGAIDASEVLLVPGIAYEASMAIQQE